MAYKGKYHVKNRSKYVGNVDKVVYRSLWERTFMKYCDDNPSVIAWNSEEVVIPYYSPVDNKMHKYYVDFLIKTRDSDGKIRHVLIEVKPDNQTRPPVMGKTKKSKYRYLRELKTWKVNEAKWKHAEEFCKDRKWEFKILTEKQLVK
jgi:hypothetical protein